MSDDIRIATGEYVPIQDTICECGHWYDEHSIGVVCEAPGCACPGFIADPEQSTAAQIADRGGDPYFWPEHAKRARSVLVNYNDLIALLDYAQPDEEDDYEHWDERDGPMDEHHIVHAIRRLRKGAE